MPAKKGRPIPGFTINRDGALILDATIVSLLKQYRAQPFFLNAGGYHVLRDYLRRDYNFFINPKKLYRICREEKLLLPKVKKRRKFGIKIAENRSVNTPNMLWQFDIKYGYIHGENRFFYLLAFIDIFTREVISYHVGLTCKGQDLKNTFATALANEKITDDNKLVIRSDRGTQMTSWVFKNFIKELADDFDLSVEHEIIPVHNPNRNAYIESFFSIVEVALLQAYTFDSFRDAYAAVVDFIDFYNKFRIHGSLNGMSPHDFKNWWLNKISDSRSIVIQL